MTHLLETLESCQRLSDEIAECLRLERQFLIEFRLEDLLQNNFKKDGLILAFTERKKEFKNLLTARYGISDYTALPSKLSSEERVVWETAVTSWEKSWEATKKLCEENQRFIGNSLRYLGVFADHLKRLFGEPSLYNGLGKKMEPNSQGKVVEARY